MQDGAVARRLTAVSDCDVDVLTRSPGSTPVRRSPRQSRRGRPDPQTGFGLARAVHRLADPAIAAMFAWFGRDGRFRDPWTLGWNSTIDYPDLETHPKAESCQEGAPAWREVFSKPVQPDVPPPWPGALTVRVEPVTSTRRSRYYTSDLTV